MLKYFAITGIILLCLNGCSAIPFKKAIPVSVENADPESVKEQFALKIADKFRIINTIVFEYKGQAFSFIGYSDVDTKEKIFTVAGINPVGVKLFELTGEKDKTVLKFAIGDFTKKGNFTEAVGGDIRKIFFDRLPETGAKVYKNKNEIVFTQNEGDAIIEYVFAGQDNLLVEKRCLVDNKSIWSVNYYEYTVKNGKLHPLGIILKNYKYGYRLILRLKEVRS
ncbi:hypothetical protein [Desulfobacterium sp. N47]|uniref:hypothetical protein n=1 Tax=Desulfobacterium sp. N47 TaxID=3115210 RepID=UPI003F4A1F69